MLGKPAAPFYQSALELLGCDPGQGVMIGDDIRGDIAAAQAAGLRGLLVHTGKYRPADLNIGITPDGQLESIADLPDWWQQQMP